jgi:hypothetical protein
VSKNRTRDEILASLSEAPSQAALDDADGVLARATIMPSRDAMEGARLAIAYRIEELRVEIERLREDNDGLYGLLRFIEQDGLREEFMPLVSSALTSQDIALAGREEWDPLGPIENMPESVQRDIRTERGFVRVRVRGGEEE